MQQKLVKNFIENYRNMRTNTKTKTKVVIVVKTPLATTEEKCYIEKITTTEIFIEGLDSPFDRKTGKKIDVFPGASVFIKDFSSLKL